MRDCRTFGWLTALTVTVILSSPAYAEDNMDDDLPSAEYIADTTSFVWFSDKKDFEGVKGAIPSLLDKHKFMGSPVIWYDDELGFLLPVSVSSARKLLLDPALAGAGAKASVESNSVVYGFDTGCDVPASFPGTQLQQLNIKRVTGSYNPSKYEDSATVWIVDSGVAADFDGNPADKQDLVVDARLSCTATGCAMDAANKKDKVGHGTMIAGIIGALDNQWGVVGIAPGVHIKSLRIFNGRQAKTNLAVIKQAMKYLDGNGILKAGDVINISWGFSAAANSGDVLDYIEGKLRKFADNGVKIAVAAGNRGGSLVSGYVYTMSPARLGGYKNNTSKGAILTASSSSAAGDTGAWVDTFAEDSFFGNGSTLDGQGYQDGGPPDFAEPGDNITSLWPRGFINECSGTSFAAAHLTGILVWNLPTMDGRAKFDPSALLPGKVLTNPPVATDFDEKLYDPVGIKTP